MVNKVWAWAVKDISQEGDDVNILTMALDEIRARRAKTLFSTIKEYYKERAALGDFIPFKPALISLVMVDRLALAYAVSQEGEMELPALEVTALSYSGTF
jgi:hypothetical protein